LSILHLGYILYSVSPRVEDIHIRAVQIDGMHTQTARPTNQLPCDHESWTDIPSTGSWGLAAEAAGTAISNPGGQDMKKYGVFLVVVLLAAVPAMAGDKGTCDGNPDDCAKKMQAKLAHKAWLGISYETDENGRWVVTSVEPHSPAQKAGFAKGDVVLAVDGVAFSKENKAALKAVYTEMQPGSEATYVVKRKGAKVKLQATLSHVPDELQAKWIAEHMSKSHPETQMAAK
jgi:hypothetical protein